MYSIHSTIVYNVFIRMQSIGSFHTLRAMSPISCTEFYRYLMIRLEIHIQSRLRMCQQTEWSTIQWETMNNGFDTDISIYLYYA